MIALATRAACIIDDNNDCALANNSPHPIPDVGFFDGIVYHQERGVCEVGIQDALHFVLQVAERVHANFQVEDAVALV